MYFMNIYEELEKILSGHDCNCYKIDKENNKLIYVEQDTTCTTLNPAIANVTGYLLMQHIEYEMDEKHNILIKTIEKPLSYEKTELEDLSNLQFKQTVNS